MLQKVLDVAGIALGLSSSCLNGFGINKNSKKITELTDQVTALEKKNMVLESCFIGFGAAAITADIINKVGKSKLKKRLETLEETVETLQGSCVKQADLAASTEAILKAINK